MCNIKIIGACTDLGVDIDGADIGPKNIINNLNNNCEKLIIEKPYCIKSKDPKDFKKNLKEVNIFNNDLFNEVSKTIKDNNFPITIGGDHSLAIGSALASQSLNKNLGIIWIDAHLDYNTFETTITGNLHGLPLAAINGIAKDLTHFTNDFINPKNTVVVGYRSKEINSKDELNNIKKMGVSVFTNEDIKKHGIVKIMEEAIKVASNGTNGFHISYDLDIIDKNFSPGVSVPELDGIDEDTAYKIADILANDINKLKSFDLVEYNPKYDIDNKTLDIALNILNKIINAKNKK